MSGPDPRVWLTSCLRHAPRLLGWLDRDPASGARGSFDRTWWGWKFSDAPFPRLQEAAFVLAALYVEDDPANRWRGHPRLLDHLAHALDVWRGLQHADGSFDEAYPWERSVAATAFTSVYVAEALQLVDDRLPATVVAHADAALGRAGRWLAAHDEHHGVLTNHRAAVVLALALAGARTGDEALTLAAEQRLTQLLDTLDATEGWFPEYGGADPGYQTATLHYLVRLEGLVDTPALDDALARAVDFVAWCVHPDGSLGGLYARRKTTLAFPAAFERLSALPRARAVAHALRQAALDGTSTGLDAVDRFNTVPMWASTWWAWRHHGTDTPAPPLPCATTTSRWLPHAGLAVKSTPAYHAIVGGHEGGVLQVIAKDADGRARAVHHDAGWLARASGRTWSSQWHDPAAPQREAPDRITVDAAFHAVRDRRLDPSTFAAFRAVTTTVGRLAAAARPIKQLLVDTLVTGDRTAPGRLRRTVVLGDDHITVDDTVTWPGLAPDDLSPTGWFAPIHMGSARYTSGPDALPALEVEAETVQQDHRWVRRTRLRFEEGT